MCVLVPLYTRNIFNATHASHANYALVCKYLLARRVFPCAHTIQTRKLVCWVAMRTSPTQPGEAGMLIIRILPRSEFATTVHERPTQPPCRRALCGENFSLFSTIITVHSQFIAIQPSEIHVVVERGKSKQPRNKAKTMQYGGCVCCLGCGGGCLISTCATFQPPCALAFARRAGSRREARK